MNRLSAVVILLSIAIISGFGCDSTSLPPDEAPVLIKNLVISPSEVVFTSNDGIRDTTLAIEMQADVSGYNEQNLVEYSIVSDGEKEITGTFQSGENESRIITTVQLTLSTSDFKTLRVFVFGFNNNSEGEIVEGKIKIRGVSTISPQIIDAFNTETVTIPSSGQEEISFFARVVHPAQQSLIERVEFFLIDQSGSRLGGAEATFEMFDDGLQNIEQGLIDEFAADSLYSRALFINENNQPDMVDVFYFATDMSGLRSDTVHTQLEIRE